MSGPFWKTALVRRDDRSSWSKVFNFDLLLLAIETADGLLNGHNAGSDTNAALVPAGLVSAGLSPETEAILSRAGKEGVAAEEQVVVLINGPALTLAALGSGLSTGGVTHNTHTCGESQQLSFLY